MYLVYNYDHNLRHIRYGIYCFVDTGQGNGNLVFRQPPHLHHMWTRLYVGAVAFPFRIHFFG